MKPTHCLIAGLASLSLLHLPARSEAQVDMSAQDEAMAAALETESPEDRARIRSELLDEVADYRAQSVGAGFMTVFGIVLAVASLPGLIATVFVTSLGGSEEASIGFGLATAVSLVGGLVLSVGGGIWWMDSNRNAEALSVRLAGVALRPWAGRQSGGLTLSSSF